MWWGCDLGWGVGGMWRLLIDDRRNDECKLFYTVVDYNFFVVLWVWMVGGGGGGGGGGGAMPPPPAPPK